MRDGGQRCEVWEEKMYRGRDDEEGMKVDMEKEKGCHGCSKGKRGRKGGGKEQIK